MASGLGKKGRGVGVSAQKSGFGAVDPRRIGARPILLCARSGKLYANGREKFRIRWRVEVRVLPGSMVWSRSRRGFSLISGEQAGVHIFLLCTLEGKLSATTCGEAN